MEVIQSLRNMITWEMDQISMLLSLGGMDTIIIWVEMEAKLEITRY